MPKTNVYFAKDVTLPKLLEEMTRGLGSVIDYNRDDMYSGEFVTGDVTGGVIGGMTVEEKLEQVMRSLGVDDNL
ncbi:91_t:CDS:2 [Entrophospora sp. SA101]|nr:91_t:CDS:2 [Entrophospora sp. SA101]